MERKSSSFNEIPKSDVIFLVNHAKYLNSISVIIIKLKIISFIESFLLPLNRPQFINEFDFKNLITISHKIRS